MRLCFLNRREAEKMNRNAKIVIKKNFNKTVAVGIAAMMGIVPSASAVFAADSSTSKVTKDETVYVNADADGKVSKITVSDQLVGAGSEKSVKDASSLSDIQNVKGDETYTGSGDSMVWDSDGNDIYYQGSSDKELPVGVNFTYYLDGKEIAPKDLAGKSGKLTIKIQYTNNTSVQTKVGDKTETMKTPFVMMTGLILPGDNFSNVTIDNGKVINDGSRNIVLGFGVPGLKEDLDLDSVKDKLKDAKNDADKLNDTTAASNTTSSDTKSSSATPLKSESVASSSASDSKDLSLIHI